MPYYEYISSHLSSLCYVYLLFYLLSSIICFFLSDEEEEEDFSAGVHTFLGNVHGRKKACTDLEELSIKDVGIEQRLVAAMTFEKTYW